MKKLILIRHAKSSWKDPNLSDHDRPINKRGKRDAPFMGEQLAKLGVYPDLVLSSTATRAKITIKHILEAIPFMRHRITYFTKESKELYHPSGETIIKYIQEIGVQIEGEVLALVGHNPGFTELVNLLVKNNDLDMDGIDNLPTCGIYCIAFPKLKKWSKLEVGAGQQEFYIYPKGFQR